MKNKEAIKEDLIECVDQLISNYELDIEITEVENKINNLVDALVFDEDEDENEWDPNDTFIEYRDDIDDFFGE